MAQMFIQGVPEVQSAGIGNQQLVSAPRPGPGDLINNITNTFMQGLDAGSKIYAENKARSLVTESIEEFDAALAVAEERRDIPDNILRPGTPEGVALEDSDWTVLEQAVRSGGVSQDRAQLIASSQLRSKIARQPMFARQLRQAASNVVGFNIESEAARQYFAMLPSEADLRKGPSGYAADKMEQAQAYAEAWGVDVNEAYRTLLRDDHVQAEKRLLENMKAVEGISAIEWANETVRLNSSTSFEQVLAQLKAFSMEGQSIDSVAVNTTLSSMKEMHLEELRQGFPGDISSPEFQRVVERVNQTYQGYEDLINAVGFDNLDQIRIDRAARLRTTIGDEHFFDIKLIGEVYGQQTTAEIFTLLSNITNDTQRDMLFARNPLLRRAYETLGKDPTNFSQRVMSTAREILEGNVPADASPEEVDGIILELQSSGDDEVKDNLARGLIEAGANYKLLSVLAQKSPRNASVLNIEHYQRMYKEDMPRVLNEAARVLTSQLNNVNRFGDPAVSFEVAEDGTISFQSLRPGSWPQGAQRELRATVDKLNQFSEGFRNGWGNHLDESVEDYRLRVIQAIDNAERGYQGEVASERQTLFVQSVHNGDLDVARNRFEELKETFPELYTKDFDTVFDEIRRLRLEGGAE